MPPKYGKYEIGDHGDHNPAVTSSTRSTQHPHSRPPSVYTGQFEPSFDVLQLTRAPGVGTTKSVAASVAYDPIRHLSIADIPVAWIEKSTGPTSTMYHDSERVLLVCRGTSIARFTEDVALALAQRETPNTHAAAILAAQRLLPLDRLAFALACNDHGVSATARDLGVSPVVIRRRLDNLDTRERGYLHSAITTVQHACITSTCPRYQAG